MGMAASQARYLQLSARKTNTEYEGQQLNQERVVLANRTADLFNQMLTMSVPTCPDSNDFTKVQYSWSDGYNDAVLSDYYQLSTADEEYNYVVTSYHYEDVYTGSRRQINDPKIQSDRTVEYKYDSTYNKNLEFIVSAMQYNLKDDTYTIMNEKRVQKTFERALDGGDVRLELDSIFGRTKKASSQDFTLDEATGNYIYNTGEVDEEGKPITLTYVPVDTELDDEKVKLLKATYKTEYNPENAYFYNEETGTFFVDEGIERLKLNMGMPPEITIRKQDDGTVYYTDGERYVTLAELQNITPENNKLVLKQAIESMYFSNFAYVGNCKLHQLTLEDYQDEDIQTELRQIIIDMHDEEKGHKVSAANLDACFDPVTGEYKGGIYTFKMNNVVYYTTLADLEASAQSAFENDNQKIIADNNIDPQTTKLAYYKAVYLNTKIEDTTKALLETDGKGRFKSVRFEDDSTVYTLNTETITDEDAYRDAMNQYYYKQEKYDKAIRDINAKTELIQAQDRTLELRMKQLDTEQNALQTEMEAVKKVISKNVETTFKTFSGG
ncbi:hypothetical protein J6O48_01185 [bacterium]|nr:hypothetical protein [bacterium]